MDVTELLTAHSLFSHLSPAAIYRLIELTQLHTFQKGDLILQEAEKRGYRGLTPSVRNERGGNITVSGNFDPARMRDALREKRIMVNARGGGIRVSPHFYNTEEEIIAFFKMLDRLAE